VSSAEKKKKGISEKKEEKKITGGGGERMTRRRKRKNKKRKENQVSRVACSGKERRCRVKGTLRRRKIKKDAWGAHYEKKSPVARVTCNKKKKTGL